MLMNNFKEGGFKKRGGNFGGKPSFGGQRGGSRFGGGRDRGDRGNDRPMQKFSATCASCQKSCEVPFRPTGDKPVYCSECFGKKTQDEGFSPRGGERRDGGRSFEKRPARSDSFDRGARPSVERPRENDNEIKQRLTIIEARLNRILDLINPPTKPEAVVVSKKETRKTEKATKKEVDKPALSEVVKKAVKKVAPKKEVVKKEAKKKVVAKKAAKKTK